MTNKELQEREDARWEEIRRFQVIFAKKIAERLIAGGHMPSQDNPTMGVSPFAQIRAELQAEPECEEAANRMLSPNADLISRV